jgi:hypothetical protein
MQQLSLPHFCHTMGGWPRVRAGRELFGTFFATRKVAELRRGLVCTVLLVAAFGLAGCTASQPPAAKPMTNAEAVTAFYQAYCPVTYYDTTAPTGSLSDFTTYFAARAKDDYASARLLLQPAKPFPADLAAFMNSYGQSVQAAGEQATKISKSTSLEQAQALLPKWSAAVQAERTGFQNANKTVQAWAEKYSTGTECPTQNQ